MLVSYWMAEAPDMDLAYALGLQVSTAEAVHMLIEV